MIKMDEQDYEYYEARAKDVKLDDITSSQHNADVLERLRDNDPDFTQICIAYEFQGDGDFVVREGDHLGWLGYFVGRSKHVEDLFIFHFPDNLKIDAFFGGLGHNRSIETLGIIINLGESFQSLGPFFRNNTSLSDLTFGGFDIGLQCARNIALLLGQRSSLKCLCFEDNNLGDEEIVEIASALRTKPQIEELNLCDNRIGRNGCVALRNALEGMQNPALATLNLGDNVIDDEGLFALVAGLKNCHKLTSLCLSENGMINAAGLRSLCTLIQSEHCRLECLDLDQKGIDDDKAAVLAAGLASLSTLKRLSLSYNSIGDQGLQALVGGLVNCNIEELKLSNSSFSVLGLRSLGTLMQRGTSFTSLWLFSSAINDERLQCLVEGMANCYNLTKLGLSCNPSITAVGLMKLSAIFQCEKCCLKELWLRGIDFGDDGAVALANGLVGNKSLKTLEFSRSGMTSRGWAAFSKLLCDTSSVNNTYFSNHTLETIGGCSINVIPSDIVEYLKFNKSQNCDAAICKIIDSHPDIDIEPMFQWKLKCLPLVVSRLECARSCLGNVNESTGTFHCRQLSSLYKFVRGMPQLSVDGYRGKEMKDIQSMTKKRKFDQTL